MIFCVIVDLMETDCKRPRRTCKLQRFYLNIVVSILAQCASFIYITSLHVFTLQLMMHVLTKRTIKIRTGYNYFQMCHLNSLTPFISNLCRSIGCVSSGHSVLLPQYSTNIKEICRENKSI